MTTASRRTFLAATGTGAAAAALVTGPTAHASPAGDTQGVPETGPDLVAYVADVSTGQVTLLVGEDEIVVHDPALVRSLTAAARR